MAGGAIAGTVKFLFWVFDEWQKRGVSLRQDIPVPKETLRIATKPEGNCWWHMGRRGEDPTMQIVGSVFVTNISSRPVRIPQAELGYGLLGRKRVHGMIMVARSMRENMYGIYDIPPNETRDSHFDFWVYPPVAKLGEPFTARSVALMDQFGNRHEVKRLIFVPSPSQLAQSPKQPEEFVYAIADPIAKEIVSVLKSEVARYEVCGRRVGGLGSVHIVYNGRPLTGVGTDSWTPDSPLNQLIVSDPGAALLNSDNLGALLGLYASINDQERARFVSALLNRLGKDTGYLSVSYFIVAVLWKVGRLKDALEKSRRDLPTGEQNQFGLSNVLMVLNGLLKYRHPDFTGEMLDDIERLIHGLDEHTFKISERIAAIRANRLPKHGNEG